MNKSLRISPSKLIVSALTIQTVYLRLFILSFCLMCFSSITFAQTQVVTQQLINQYKLDFSDPQPGNTPYLLVVGSNGALYLRNTANGSHLKISQRMNGVPAKVVTGNTSQLLFQADKNFENIVYVSKDPNITPGDSGDSEDVFIYNVSEKKTIRIQGHKAHAGPVGQVRINAEGDTVAFNSYDWFFADTSNIDKLGYSLDQFDGEQPLIYLSKIIDFDSGTSLPFTPKHSATPYDASRDSRGTTSWLCYPSCQFQGDSIIFEWDNPNFIFTNGYLYSYNINREVLTDIEFSYSSELGDASNSAEYVNDARHVITRTREFSLGGGGTDSIDYLVYDTLLSDKFPFSEDFPTLNYNNFRFTDSPYKAHGGVSENNRYLSFYAMKLQGSEFTLDYNTGIIHVFDTWTGEFRPAFSVDRNAQSFGYLDNNYLYNKTTCINCDGIDDYEIEPSDIRFHNNDQYITFEANSWYLDSAVPYASFAVPYARDLFVVANPFNNDEDQATCGVPDTTASTDGDTYLWRDCATGQWHLQISGSDNVQNLTGKIVADQGINNILAENLEAADQYTSSSTALDFNLNVQAGDEDGFSFYLTSLTDSCIDITNTDAVNVRVGARQIALPVPFDLKTLEPVSDCGDDGSIAVDGAPIIDYSTDQGWYIWRENGIWQNRFSAGGTEIQFIGSLESTLPMSNLQPNSIEPRDSLELNPATVVNFNVYVTGPYRDGFSVAISDMAATCASLTSATNVNIYLGPDAIRMPNAFDLKTLGGCGTTPNIETLGKPAIDRTTDNGIFLWENSDHNWQAEVVSGDIRRTIDIDVSSQQTLTDIEQINIESNDVFTIMAMSLDLSLRVRSPWYDGFKFIEQDQSGTCVSTTNNETPIFLGPERVDVGSSINLSTQASCP